MKTIYALFAALLISFPLLSQVSVSQRDNVDKKFFRPVTIELNDGTVKKGYGQFTFLGSDGIYFVDSLPKKDGKVKDSYFYGAAKIKQAVKISLENDTTIYQTIKIGKLPWLKRIVYKDSKIELFFLPEGILYFPDEMLSGHNGAYYIRKIANQELTSLTVIDKLAKKPMYNVIGKFFNDCPALEAKVKAGEYKITYEDLMAIIKFYETCGK